MLKGIPANVTPELMYCLMQMGHGDEIVLADGNFPAESMGCQVVRADGHSVVSILTSVLQFLPLDTFVESPAVVMRPVDEGAPQPEVWTGFSDRILAAEQRHVELLPLERFEFYERSRHAFAIVATSDTAIYANLILKKGVVVPANVND